MIAIIVSLGNLPVRCVVPEIVEGSPFQYPVEVVKAVLEASKVSQPRGVVSGVLEDVHGPCPTTGEIRVARTFHVAPAVLDLCQWLLVYTDASVPVHEADVAIMGCIAGLDAPEIRLCSFCSNPDVDLMYPNTTAHLTVEGSWW